MHGVNYEGRTHPIAEKYGRDMLQFEKASWVGFQAMGTGIP